MGVTGLSKTNISFLIILPKTTKRMFTNLLKKIVISVSKYTIIGLMFQCLVYTVIFASSGNAQIKSIDEVYVTIDIENLSIEEVFQRIENSTGFRFAYRKGIIDQKKRFPSNSNYHTLGNLLRYIAQSTDLSFLRVDEVIHVKKQEKGGSVAVVESQNLQSRIITGTVTSMEDGISLPGVNILEKGTSNGTITDFEGRYSLEVTEGATLVFSSVGYTSEEIPIGTRQVIDLVMLPDIRQLQELVVVGYGM
jgi:TonB-dependent starch-binding outer membrane protein SusC